MAPFSEGARLWETEMEPDLVSSHHACLSHGSNQSVLLNSAGHLPTPSLFWGRGCVSAGDSVRHPDLPVSTFIEQNLSPSLDMGWPASPSIPVYPSPGLRPAQELQEDLPCLLCGCLGFALRSSNSTGPHTLSMEPSSQPPLQGTPGHASSLWLKP